MRILYEYTRGTTCHGLRRVFEAAGHEFTIWGTPAVPAFDIFDEVNPHLFIQTRLATRAVSKCVAEHHTMKVVEDFDPQGAADTFLCNNAYQKDTLLCDFSYVGDHDIKKESYILPLAQWGNLKIFGSGPWPSPCSLGRVTDPTSCIVHASSRVCLHVTTDGRVSDHLYNAMLIGGICIVNKLEDKSIPGDIVLCGYTPSGFHQLATGLLGSDLDPWKKMARKYGREIVLAKHTYWQRAESLLRKAGFESEASKLMGVFRATVTI